MWGGKCAYFLFEEKKMSAEYDRVTECDEIILTLLWWIIKNFSSVYKWTFKSFSSVFFFIFVHQVQNPSKNFHSFKNQETNWIVEFFFILASWYLRMQQKKTLNYDFRQFFSIHRYATALYSVFIFRAIL